MPLPTLSTVTCGAPDNGFERLLQFGTQSFSSGGLVGLGEGTESKLWLDDLGIGVANAGGFKSFLRTLASADRIITLADKEGTLMPEVLLESILSAEHANSTTTPDPVPSFGLSLDASTTYEVDMMLIMQSVATTTSPRLRLTGPSAETDWMGVEVQTGLSGTGLSAPSNKDSQLFTDWGNDFNNANNMHANNAPQVFRVRGVLRTTASAPATAVGLSIWSENASSEIKILAGSFMRFRKLA